MSEYFQNFNHLIKIYIQCIIQNSQTSERFCCLLYWPKASIKCHTAMIAVGGRTHQLHVPNGTKRQMRTSESFDRSVYTLWVCLRGNWTTCQTASRKYHKWHNMEQGWKVCSHKAGHVTTSISCQSTGTKHCTKHCIVEQCIQAIYIAQQVNWSRSSVNLHWQCDDCQSASETCSWPEQSSRL